MRRERTQGEQRRLRLERAFVDTPAWGKRDKKMRDSREATKRAPAPPRTHLDRT